MSLRFRLFILVLVASLASVGLLVWNQIALLGARYHEIETQVLGLARQQSAELTQLGEGALQFLAALSQAPSIRDGEAANCERQLKAIVPNFPQYNSLVRSDLEGNVLCSSTGAKFGVADRMYLKRIKEGRLFAVGDYVYGKSTNRPTLHFAYAIRSNDTTVGVLSAGLSLDWLTDRLKDRHPPGTAVNIVDSSDTIVLRFPANDKFQGAKVPGEFRWIVHSQIPGVTQVTGLDGVRQISEAPPGEVLD
jgi:cache domain-containing protein